MHSVLHGLTNKVCRTDTLHADQYVLNGSLAQYDDGLTKLSGCLLRSLSCAVLEGSFDVGLFIGI
jgi:hypothetical protein